MRTVLAEDLKPGMIIKCGYIVLSNVKYKHSVLLRELVFLTATCRILVTKVGNHWDYECL